MKLRFTAVLGLLFILACIVPASFAQGQGKTKEPVQTFPDTDKANASDKQTPGGPTVQPADPDKVKHDGGRTDVDAIGNRNVGCARGLGNWYRVEKQIAMGK